MNDIDHTQINWQLLKTFLTVLEEGSITGAAARLNVTQSTVSHSMNRLRKILGDPLFVRSGQGISATERARSLRAPVETILDDIKGLGDQRDFDPRASAMEFVVAANDLTRDWIFPDIHRKASHQGVNLSLTFFPSGVPSISVLREARCQLMITPLPPEGPDILQQKILEAEMVCFYDGSVRGPPTTWEDFLADNHIEGRFSSGRTSLSVLQDIDTSRLKPPKISVSNFGALAPFLKDSDLLATEIQLMANGPLKDLSFASLPFDTELISIFMVWHQRDSNDPAHKWLRDRIRESATALSREQAK